MGWLSLILTLAGLATTIASEANKSSKTKDYQKEQRKFQEKQVEKENEAGKRGALTRALLQFSGGEYDPQVTKDVEPVLDTSTADMLSGIGGSVMQTGQAVGGLGNKGADSNNIMSGATATPKATASSYSTPITESSYVGPSAARDLALKKKLGIA